MSRLLEGIRVIESATLFNGDHAGMLLGDLGADVIKVESPFQGDYLRDFLGQITPHHSPAHVQVNKNKRSVTLDLRTPEGKAVFWRLLATADVFLDGNASDACEKLGVGYEEQRRHKADIVYCQVSGYGAKGDYAAIPTHGQMMNALAAATPMEMGSDGFTRPVPPRGGMGGTEGGGDGTANAGVHAACHIAAALVRRLRTGEGCFIDVSGADATIAAAWIGATYDLNRHRVTDASSMPAPRGSSDTGSAKYQFYETADRKFLLFCCIEHKFWDNFCLAVGREDLVGKKNTAAPVDFAGGETELRRELQHIFHTKPLSEWVSIARANDIPMGPAPSSVLDLLDDPHMKQREIFSPGYHPHCGEFTYVGAVGIVQGQPYQVRYPAPLLGEHTRTILGEIGCSQAEIDTLAAAKVI